MFLVGEEIIAERKVSHSRPLTGARWTRAGSGLICGKLRASGATRNTMALFVVACSLHGMLRCRHKRSLRASGEVRNQNSEVRSCRSCRLCEQGLYPKNPGQASPRENFRRNPDSLAPELL